MSDEGYVFALLSCPYKGMIKIDKTKENPEERVKKLSKADEDSVDNIIAYEIFVSDLSSAEEYLKSLLDSSGYNSKNKKFYEIKLKNLIPLMIKVNDKFGIPKLKGNSVEKGTLEDYSRFGLPELNSFRTIKTSEGDLFWFGKDVAKFLEIEDLSTIKKILSPRDYTYFYIDKGDERPTFLIQEFGLYKLLMDTHIHKLTQFRRWLINKVLPSLFREGEYSIGRNLRMTIEIRVAAENSDVTRYNNHIKTVVVSTQKFLDSYNSFIKIFNSKLHGDKFLELENKLNYTTDRLNIMLEDIDRLLDFFSDTIVENHLKTD